MSRNEVLIKHSESVLGHTQEAKTGGSEVQGLGSIVGSKENRNPNKPIEKRKKNNLSHIGSPEVEYTNLTQWSTPCLLRAQTSFVICDVHLTFTMLACRS